MRQSRLFFIIAIVFHNRDYRQFVHFIHELSCHCVEEDDGDFGGDAVMSDRTCHYAQSEMRAETVAIICDCNQEDITPITSSVGRQ